MKRIVAGAVVFALLVGCSTSNEPGNPRPRTQKPLAGVRTAQGMVLQVRKIDRLSPTEAKLNVRIFNPGAVPLPQKTGPDYFFVAPAASTATPIKSFDPNRTTAKTQELAPRQSMDAEILLKLPDPGAIKVYYGETADVNVFVVTIDPFKP